MLYFVSYIFKLFSIALIKIEITFLIKDSKTRRNKKRKQQLPIGKNKQFIFNYIR